MSGDFSLVEKLLHQKFVFNIVIWKFINAEKAKMAIILNPRLKSL